ncbi:RING-4 like protein [Purpureocillium lavendulum]|uniref:RING-4 like protein n=1 Tax=Purpureocillium lavendulum TaxID=1247861 RepID=A0AB34FLF0_9HYPO|nr:RING-4 like protein [Purpureocillium lavendulum]
MDAQSRKRQDGDVPGPDDRQDQHPSKRFQVPRACQRCKSLRRGCDEHRPCQRCLRAGLGDECVGGSAWPAVAPVSAPGHDAANAWTRVVAEAQGPVVEECARLFFDLCHPTIPILTPDYVARLRDAAVNQQTGIEACTLLVAMCAHVLLHVEAPSSRIPGSAIPEDYVAYGQTLLDTASTTYQTIHWPPAPTLDSCLLAFFLYAGQNRLARHSKAFLCLRQATTLWVLVKDHKPPSPTAEALLNRLFWVLLISERSHAIRYGRSITLHVTPDVPDIDVGDTSFHGFRSLAALFRPIDSAFMAIKNGELMLLAVPPEALDRAERAINSAIPASAILQDTQKANLRITKLWLRIIIWQLRLRLGLLTETSHHRNLTYRYPVDIAKELTLSTRDLPIHTIHVHGIGLTEKLFDVASAVVDVMAQIPHTSASARGMSVEGPPEEDLAYLRGLILQLPGGVTVYNDLLEKHIQQALPAMASPGSHTSPGTVSLISQQSPT